MKKLLLPLLIASMFANAEEYLEIKALKNLIKQENTITTAVGEYKFGPDTSESDACTIAESIAKENAILKGTYRGDEWRIEQFNRNRAQRDQVAKIEEMKYGNKEPLQLNLFEDK